MNRVFSRTLTVGAVAALLACSAFAAQVIGTGGTGASGDSNATMGSEENKLAGPPVTWAANTQLKNHGTVGIATPYIPIVACRLVDTRGVFSPVYGGPAFAANEVRTYNIRGSCGVPANASIRAASLQVVVPPPAAAGDIEILPSLGTFGNTVAMVFEAGKWNSVSVNVKANANGNEIDVQVRSSPAHVVIDIVGYFADGLGTNTEMYLNSTPSTNEGVLNVDLVGAVAGTSAISTTALNAGVDLSTADGNAISITSGGLRVVGAGLGTGTTAFQHKVSTAVYGAGGTLCAAVGGGVAVSVIDHPLTNGNPNALVFITPTGGNGTAYGGTNPNNTYWVFYGPGCTANTTQRWSIVTTDQAAIQNSIAFNVLVIRP